MLTKETIHYLRTVIAPQREPVLSLYLDINPAKQENARGAALIRVKDELKRLALPKPYAEALLEKLTHAFGIPQARSAVIFAGEDLGTFFEYHSLHFELPQLKQKGILARWGKPYVLPLLQVIDSQEHYGAVVLDQARFRYFEIFFGDIQELEAAFRPLDPSHWRTFTEANTGVVQGVPARGGMGKDKFERRKDNWTHLFYKDVTSILEQAMSANEVQYLFLLGPSKNVQEFRGVLSLELAQKVIDCLPPPANSAASAQEILSLLEPCIERHRQAKEKSLLEHLQETGVQGLEPTLEALQAGRLQVLVAWQESEYTVYRCSESGYVAASLSGIAKHCPEQTHELVLLHDVLPELTESFATKLCYLSDETAQVLTSAGVGLAGLKRW